MFATQKRLFLLVGMVFAVVAFSLSISLFGHQRVYADYTVDAGQKCQNGSSPTLVPGATLTYNCAENTRTGTDQQTTAGTTPTQNDATGDANNDPGTTCAVEKIGWIVCPILEGMAKISDKMFDVLANNFLSTDVSLIRDTMPGSTEASGTKQAWEVARNLANIMFIIAFLIIIISQVTNMGISNYGIKKMLPRLVVAAIAVNISYYICQLAADLTNILGYEIQNALAQISDSIGPSVFGHASNFSAFATGGGEGLGNAKDAGVLTVIIVAALASTAAWLILGPGLAIISVVAISVLTILIILMLRKAIIVLLIVISPIAFVLYLLPNTEKYFSKWMKMFGQLLLVFPVVGLLFGAGQLASTVILVSGATTPPTAAQTCDPDAPVTAATKPSSSNYDGKCDGYISLSGTQKNPGDPTKSLGSKGASWTLGLVAVGVAVAPLMAIYAVLKGALSAAGAIGGTIKTMQGKATGGASRFAKIADENRRKTINANALEGGFGHRTAGFARRRKMNNELRDARLQTAQDLFAAGDPRASAISEETRRKQMLGNAAKQKQAEEFIGDVARGNILIATPADGQHAGGLDKQVGAQQAKALAEAVKDVELSIDTNDLDQLSRDMMQARLSGDKITARAIENTLLRAGAGGQVAFHNAVNGAQRSGMTADMENDMRENMRVNHPGIKDADTSLGDFASKGGNLAARRADAATWDNLTAAKFASLSTQGQAQAARTMSAAAKTRLSADLKASPSDLAKVSGDAKANLPGF